MSSIEKGTSIKSAVVNGAIWTLGGYALAETMRLGGHICMAWFLAPEVFGLMALMNVFLRGLQLFSDVGIQPCIIQSKRGTDPEFLNTAWTIQAVRGVALWIASSLLALPVASFYAKNDPAASQLGVLIPVLAFASVISGFESTALATLNKDLKLAKTTSLELSSQLIGLIATLSLLLITPSIWALTIGGLASPAWKTWMSHRLVKEHSARFRWNTDCAQELIRYGRWIFLSTLFSFLASNSDRIILGGFLTMAQLGLYSIAESFSRIPITVCTRLSHAVLFPMYSNFSRDPKRMMEKAIRAREIVLWAGMGIGLSSLVGARLFFETLWDARYEGLAVVSQWMVVSVWAKLLLVTVERIPLALGNSKALLFSNIVRCVGIPLGLLGFWMADLPGFIVGMSLGPLLGVLQILPHLPSDRFVIWNQGIRFSIMSLLYGVTAVVLTDGVLLNWGYWAWITAVIFGSVLPIVVSAWKAWTLSRAT